MTFIKTFQNDTWGMGNPSSKGWSPTSPSPSLEMRTKAVQSKLF